MTRARKAPLRRPLRWAGPLAFLIVLAFATCSLHALDPRKAPTQYSIQQWSMEHGLPDSYVQAIAQTQDGYLWLGTQNAGLSRFDGVKFTSMRAPFEGVSDDVSVRAFCETQDGTLWIGTDGAGLWSWKEGKFSKLSRTNGLRNDHVRALYEDQAGRLWISVAGNTVLVLQKGQLRDASPAQQGGAPASIHAFGQGPDGTLWAAGQGLWRLRNEQLESVELPNSGSRDNFLALAFDHDGKLWLGGSRGLLRVEEQEGKTRATWLTEEDGLSDNRIRSLHTDSEGSLWIGSNNGVDRLANGKLTRCLTREKVPYDFVYTFYEDREGCLWIGNNGGLARLKDDKFTLLTTSEGLPQNIVVAAVQARDGSLWVGTWTKGVARIQNGKVTQFGRAAGLPSDEVRSLHEDERGAIWVGTTGGALSRIEAGDIGRFYPPVQEGSSVTAIQHDARNHLWLVSSAGELLKFNGSSFETIEFAASAQETAKTIHFSARSNLWLGTDHAVKLRAGNEWRAFPLPPPAHGKTVRSVYEASNGDVWVCAQNSGLIRLRDGRFTAYGPEQGLALDNFYTVAEDDQQDLWVGCKRGLFLFTTQDFADFDNRKTRELSPLDYTQLSGLRNPRFTRYGFPLHTRMTDGRLGFPTTKGVAIVDPARLPHNQVPPPVTIEKARFDLADAPAEGKMVAPPGTRDWEIHYTALSLRAPERVRFRYRLLGYDADWVEAENRRVAYYQNVPPGEYRFEVIAANEDRVWNTKGATIALIQQPRLTQTGWFYCGVVLAAGGAAWLLQRRHAAQSRRRFEAMIEERTRIARELHDTLEQGLVGVSMQLNLAAMKADRAEHPARKHLDKARYMLKHSMADARAAILDLRHELKAKNLLHELRAMVETHTEDRPVNATVEQIGQAQPLSLFAEMTLLRIAQEGLTNVLKHAEATRVAIELVFAESRVLLRITDNGRGISMQNMEKMQETRFGLLGMRERAEKMGGIFRLQSDPGRGVTIEVDVPYRDVVLRQEDKQNGGSAGA